jgi:protein involved in polysaccharide export with SLBB domain
MDRTSLPPSTPRSSRRLGGIADVAVSEADGPSIVLLPGQEGSVLTVSDHGTVEVPDLGPVQAAGKRPSDVEKAIAVGFLDRYIATLAGAVRVSSVPP